MHNLAFTCHTYAPSSSTVLCDPPFRMRNVTDCACIKSLISLVQSSVFIEGRERKPVRHHLPALYRWALLGDPPQSHKDVLFTRQVDVLEKTELRYQAIGCLTERNVNLAVSRLTITCVQHLCEQ